MSQTRKDDPNRCRQLMMADLDGELQPTQQQELQRLLNQFPELLEEYQSFKQLKEVTDSMSFKEPNPEIWETYWYNIYNKLERGLAWIIFTIGAGILIVYGLGKALSNLWHDPGVPLLLKIGIFMALFGLVLLLISVLREKLFIRRHERYKEVKR